MGTNRYAFAIAGMFLAASSAATAGGVTAYLPMNLEPEIERQIERVLILADEPILKRPFSVELVKLALPQACQVDKPLCTQSGQVPRALFARLRRVARQCHRIGRARQGRRGAAESAWHAGGQRLRAVRRLPMRSQPIISWSAPARLPTAGARCRPVPWRAWAPTGRSSTSATAIIGFRP